jgi:hypothetical protein
VKFIPQIIIGASLFLIAVAIGVKNINKTQVDSFSKITPQVALKLQGKSFFTKDGKKCDVGSFDPKKLGDALFVVCKFEQNNSLFYEGLVFGRPDGKIVSYDLPSYEGISQIATYLAVVDPKTGKFMATLSQQMQLKDGMDSAIYFTDGDSNQLGFIKLVGMEYQEVSGNTKTKKLGQVVYNIVDANKLGFKFN